MRFVKIFLLTLAILNGLSSQLRAQTSESRFLVLSGTCVSESRQDCLADLREILLGQAGVGLNDDEIGILVLALVNALNSDMPDRVFATIALALREIAALTGTDELGANILEIAAIVERRDLIVIGPEIFLASAN